MAWLAIDSRAVCSPYGGLWEQREDAHEGQDDDDPNDGGGDKQEIAGRDVMPGPGECTAATNLIKRRA